MYYYKTDYKNFKYDYNNDCKNSDDKSFNNNSKTWQSLTGAMIDYCKDTQAGFEKWLITI